MNNTPAWANEKIQLELYDPAWAAKADHFSDELTPILKPWLLKDVEHIGSTSIPGLLAKPIIDLMAQVHDKDAVASQVATQLNLLGWKHVPVKLDIRPWRQFFVRVSNDHEHRLAHLHLMSENAVRWDEQIKFRDSLRASQILRQQYAELKTALVNQNHLDREKYSQAKAAFIIRVLENSSQ